MQTGMQSGMTKETYYMTKETYYMTKETYYMTKETYYGMQRGMHADWHAECSRGR
jgi:hypothetical protein